MKTPDALTDAIIDTCKSEYDTNEYHEHEPDYDDYIFVDEKIEEIRSMCRRWFEYEEYLTVEIDTEKQTCIVVEE